MLKSKFLDIDKPQFLPLTSITTLCQAPPPPPPRRSTTLSKIHV